MGKIIKIELCKKINYKKRICDIKKIEKIANLSIHNSIRSLNLYIDVYDENCRKSKNDFCDFSLNEAKEIINRINEKVQNADINFNDDKKSVIFYYFSSVDKSIILRFLRFNVKFGNIDSIVAWKIIYNILNRQNNNNKLMLHLLNGNFNDKYSFIIDACDLRIIKSVTKIIAIIILVCGDNHIIDITIETQIINEMIELLFLNNEQKIIDCCNEILNDVDSNITIVMNKLKNLNEELYKKLFEIIKKMSSNK